MMFLHVRKQSVLLAALLAAACRGDGAPNNGGVLGPGVVSDASALPVPLGDGGFGATADGGSVATPGPLSDAGQPVSPPGGGAWCAVKAVLAARCNACHDGEGSAGTPMGLTKYADLVADSAQYPGSKIYQRVGARIHDTARPMPPQPSLTPAEFATLDAWIASGAVGSDADTCAGDGGAAPPAVDEWPADCEEKHEFRAHGTGNAPFDVRVGEFYQDFTFSAPWTGDVQAVAFRPIVDNKRVLHHYILYQGTSSFLVGWSPGKAAEPLPVDVGVHMPASGSLKLTVHYYNSGSGASATTDASGVEMCVTRKKRPHTATTMPFAANPSIPAGGQNVVNSSTCTVRASEDIHIVTSSPHMHKLGVHAKFVVQRANGQTEVIHDRPFDFEEQTTWPVDFVVRNGDRITTTCVYTNPAARAVRFGTSTDDEMCFNFSLYYPMCAMTCNQSDPVAQAWSSSQGGGCPQGASSGGLLGN